MNLYEQGFDAGERLAFEHGKKGIRTAIGPEPRTEYGRGFWDGYVPRSLKWAARLKPMRALPSWYAEKDDEGKKSEREPA